MAKPKVPNTPPVAPDGMPPDTQNDATTGKGPKKKPMNNNDEMTPPKKKKPGKR